MMVVMWMVVLVAAVVMVALEYVEVAMRLPGHIAQTA